MSQNKSQVQAELYEVLETYNMMNLDQRRVFYV
jgi:hypothetical protein